MAVRNLQCFALVGVIGVASGCAFVDVSTTEPEPGALPAPNPDRDGRVGESGVAQALTTGKHPPCAPNVASCVDMYFVAHQDDNLLFMNPDIATSIHSGNHVITVHLTSGTAGDGEATLIARELGILNAYAFMVNPSYSATTTAGFPGMLTHWQLRGGAPITITTAHYSKQAIQYDFVGAPVSLVFLRLNQQATLDETGTHAQDLEALWEGVDTGLRTTPCNSGCVLGSALALQKYQDGHSELIEVLATLMNQFHASVPGSQLVVNTQDSAGQGFYWNVVDYGTGWVDYPDHVFGANFVISAFHTFHTFAGNDLRSLREYRDYNIGQEPANLGGSDILAKQLAFARYELGVGGTRNQTSPDYCTNPSNPEYCIWTQRKYATITLSSANLLRGRLMNQSGGGQCLRLDSNVLQMGACGDAPEWQITTRNEIRLSSNPALCVQLDASSTAFVGACRAVSAADAQTLVVTSNGQIRGWNATCLQGAGTQVQATQCAGAPGNPNPRRIPAAGQNWTLLFSDPSLISSQFSDGSGVESQRSYYRTITIADGQICLRQAGGVGCAPYNGAGGTVGPPSWSLATFALWPQSSSPEYADSAGWLDDSTGSTMSFRHLSPSGGLSVCGRGYYGMLCGPPQSAAWWTGEFSTFDGWDASSTYYGSLRLADIDGDGYADVCGRSEFGVRCLTGTGSSFVNDSIWTTLYGSGWSVGLYGETLQFGDIDGDGRDDVCGRGSYGMACSRSIPNQFVDEHDWSMNVNNTGLTANSEDFGDADPEGAWSATAGRYRSIRLVDINRDGMVDVCGRGPNGIYCALSTGTAFEMKRDVMPFNFGGPTWDLEQYGSTITFGNLDGDARVDMCLRGTFGMMCSEAW